MLYISNAQALELIYNYLDIFIWKELNLNLAFSKSHRAIELSILWKLKMYIKHLNINFKTFKNPENVVAFLFW